MSDLDQYLDQFVGQPKQPKKAKRPKPVGDESVARVVDEELLNLGWSDNARLSLLGDLGRENSWDRKTIFGGHKDPKNQAFNRGIISWQGDRRKKLDDFLQKQGVYGKNDDAELRAMVRFMDEEMRGSKEWSAIHQAMRNPNISTYDASENLRKYIKYVADGPYNSHDPEFRVKNNAEWAKRARKLGLAQGGKQKKLDKYLSQFLTQSDTEAAATPTQPMQPAVEADYGATPEEIAQFQQKFPNATLPEVLPGTQPKIAPQVKPVPESDFTLEAQFGAAIKPDSPRSAVLLTEPEQLAKLSPDALAAFTPVSTQNGTLLVNKQKAAALGLKDPAAISAYVQQNGFAGMIGKVNDVGNETNKGIAVRTETPDGKELSTSIVQSPLDAVRQQKLDKAQFGDLAGNQAIVPATAAANQRMQENEQTLPEQPQTADGTATSVQVLDEDEQLPPRLQGAVKIDENTNIREAMLNEAIRLVGQSNIGATAADVEKAFRSKITNKIDGVSLEEIERLDPKLVAEKLNGQISYELDDKFIEDVITARDERIQQQAAIKNAVLDRVRRGNDISDDEIVFLAKQGVYLKDIEGLDDARLEGIEQRSRLAGKYAGSKYAEILTQKDLGNLSQAQADELVRFQEKMERDFREQNKYAGVEENAYDLAQGNLSMDDARKYAEQKTQEKIDQTLRDFGSAKRYYEETERIQKEYENRPLAQPVEAIKTATRYIAKIPATILDTAAIAKEYSPVQLAYDYLNGTDAKAATSQIGKMAQEWRKAVDEDLVLKQNKDFKNDFIVNELAEMVGQVGVQIALAPVTGGYSLALPLMEAGTAQYKEADEAGANKMTRLLAAVVGGAVAVPDVLLKAKYLKALTEAEKLGFIGKLSQSVFNRFAKLFPEQEAREATRSFVRSFIRNAPARFAGESFQEYTEDVGNDAFAKLTYNPDIDLKETIMPNNQRLRGYAAAGIGGLVGASVESVAETQATPDEQSSFNPTTYEEDYRRVLDDLAKNAQTPEEAPEAPKPVKRAPNPDENLSGKTVETKDGDQLTVTGETENGKRVIVKDEKGAVKSLGKNEIEVVETPKTEAPAETKENDFAVKIDPPKTNDEKLSEAEQKPPQVVSDENVPVESSKGKIPVPQPRGPLTAKGVALAEKPKTETVHKFSSTQVNLPKEAAAKTIAVGAKLIDDADVYTDPNDPSYGREEEPHITVKYGLHTEDAAEVEKLLAAEKPFEATLGKTSIFPGGKDSEYDVVKVDVESPELHRLNKLIADNTKVTDTFPEYKPHVTLAYVKKGAGQKYVGNTELEGQKLTFDSLAFSSKNGEIVNIPLGGATQTSTAFPTVRQVLGEFSDLETKLTETFDRSRRDGETAAKGKTRLKNILGKNAKTVDVDNLWDALGLASNDRLIGKPSAATSQSSAKALVENVKQKLVKKAERRGVGENFGETEIRALRDNPLFDPFGTAEQREFADRVQDLEDWAADYSAPSQKPTIREIADASPNVEIVKQGAPKTEKPSLSDSFRDRIAQRRAEQEAKAKDNDLMDAMKDIAKIMGDTAFLEKNDDTAPRKSVLEKPDFDENTYSALKTPFDTAFKVIAKETSDPNEQIAELVDKMLDAGMSLDTIERLEPYFVKYVEEKSLQNAPDERKNKDNDAEREQSERSDNRSDEGKSADDVSGDESGRDTRRDGENSGASRAGTRKRTSQSSDERSVDDERSNDESSVSDADQQPSSKSGNRTGDGVSTRNYIAPQGSLTREGSWKQAAKNNLDIIELVKKIEDEGRTATPEEQALLVKFTGWGASELANNLFSGARRWDPVIRPDQAREGWKELATRARDLLNEEEITTALTSTQYAHYTSEDIIRNIWSAFNKFGFRAGTIFEPGMGVGLFPIAAPQSVIQKSTYTGVEREDFTARIAKLLLPDSNVIKGDFVEENFPDDYFDIAIGNPPFSDTPILADPRYKKYKFFTHDYFFAKTIDKVRPGGILAFVSSKGTMDKQSDRMRKYISDRADLVGAIRLPQTAFKENAGTEVVTDVIFLRKRLPGEESTGEDWLNVSPITLTDKNGYEHVKHINEYFANHPEMVLGTHSLTGKMYSANEYSVDPLDGNIADHFQKAIENLPSGIFGGQNSNAKVEQIIERDFDPKVKKEGSLYVHDDGRLMVLDNGSGIPAEAAFNVSGKATSWLKSYVGLRDALKQAQYDQLTDGDWQTSLKALNKAYDAFVKKYGPITAFTLTERQTKDKLTGQTIWKTSKRFKNSSLLKVDIESPLLEALEDVNDEGKIVKGAFLKGRTIAPPAAPKIENLNDAVAASLNKVGHLNLDHVIDTYKELGEITKAELIEQLGDLIYEAPDGTWQMADEYLSGKVVDKLEQAEAAAKLNPRFERNVEALRKVQPAPLMPSQIKANLGATIFTAEDITEFAQTELNLYGNAAKVSFDPILTNWTVNGANGKGSQQYRNASSDWGTAERSPYEILEAVLNARTIIIKDTYKDGGKTITQPNPEATAAIEEIAKRMKNAFRTWVWADADRAERIARDYNRRYNDIVPRQFDGKHLEIIPGLSIKYKLYEHQKRAIWRVIQEGNTYLAHAVGSGKTLEMIVSAMEQKRLGLISKPMFVVPKSILEQFGREFLDAYPLANIMVARPEDLQKENRKRFMARAALNDLDAIIVAHSSFGKLQTSKETANLVLRDLIGELQYAISLAEEDSDQRAGKRRIKELENRIEKIEQRFLGSMSGGDDVISFEELGVDFLYVDESHEFRKLDFVTNRTNTKGIDPNGSQRALDLHIKMKYLETKRPGRSAVLASGTPLTNTLAELFTVQKLLGMADLESAGLAHFDAWANQFGEEVAKFEMNASGKYELVSRFSEFMNIPELMKRVREFMDVLTMKQLSSFVKLPKIEGGQPKITITPLSETQKDYLATLEQRIKVSREWKPSQDEPGNPDPLINIITDARLAAADMRFIDPELPNDPTSKLNVMIDNIIATYHETKDAVYYDKDGNPDAIPGAAQIVFSYLGFGDGIIQNRGFNSKKWLIDRLVEGGIKRDEIAFMGDYQKPSEKEAMFADMRSGVKKILVGSPMNMGTGVNVQKRLKHLHYLVPPWNPADIEQPDGRIVRQGNQNDEVRLERYATKGTYDSTNWQMLARKANAIEQVMSGDDSVREVSDVQESSQYEMASALAAGDERMIQLADLRRQIEQLRLLREAHRREQQTLQSELNSNASRLNYQKTFLDTLLETTADIPVYTPETFKVSIGGKGYDKRAEIGAAVLKTWTKLAKTDKAEIARVDGKYRIVNRTGETWSGKEKTARLSLELIPSKGSAVYLSATDPTKLDELKNVSDVGLAAKIYNGINNLPNVVSETQEKVDKLSAEQDARRAKIGKAFEHENELFEKIAEEARLQQEIAAEGQEVSDELAASGEDTDAQKSVLPSKLDESAKQDDEITYQQILDLPYVELDEILPNTKIERFGDRIKANAHSHELFRRVLEENKIRKGQLKRGGLDVEESFRALFFEPIPLREAVKTFREKAAEAKRLGYSAEEVAVFSDHADALEAAAKTGNGTAIIYIFDKALPHELFHQADYRGATEKHVLNRHSEPSKKKLDAHPVAKRLWERHFSKFGEYTRERNEAQRNAILRSEIPPYLLELTDDQIKSLGLTRDMVDDYLLTWFEGYAEKNGIDALDNFDKEELNVREFTGKIRETFAGENENVRPGDERNNRQQGDEKGKTGESSGTSREDSQYFDGFGLNANERRQEKKSREREMDLPDGKKLASLPFTLRAAGIDVDDMVYDVFGDQNATAEANALIEEHGVDGTLAIIKSAKDLDVHHAIASFMIQRALLDRAAELRSTDPDTAAELRERAKEIAREHSSKAIQAGRFTRAASIIGQSVENVMAAFQAALDNRKENDGRDRTFTPEQQDKYENLARQAEEALAKLAMQKREIANLKRKNKRLQDELDGKKKTRKTPQGMTLRKQLVNKVKAEKQDKVDSIREALKAKFANVGGPQKSVLEKPALLAPNGKPSNLPEHLYKMVRTKEFKEFFGDWENDPENASKVVDENGEPAVMYHGTQGLFDDFNIYDSDLGAHFGQAAQADDIVGATYSMYGIEEAEHANIMPVFLKILNPFRFSDLGGFSPRLVAPQLVDEGIMSAASAERYKDETSARGVAGGEIRQLMQSAGFDGAVYLNRREGADFWGPNGMSGDEIAELSDDEVRDEFGAEDSYIAFEPTQIKSIFNEGTFDKNNPSILKSVLTDDLLNTNPNAQLIDENMDDLATIGAMMLTEGLAQEAEYTPEQFKAEMIAEFGDMFGDKFDEVYLKSWDKRNDWLAELREEKTRDRIQKKTDKDGNPIYPHELEDWEIEEALGEEKEKNKRRRAIENAHREASGAKARREQEILERREQKKKDKRDEDIASGAKDRREQKIKEDRARRSIQNLQDKIDGKRKPPKNLENIKRLVGELAKTDAEAIAAILLFDGTGAEADIYKSIQSQAKAKAEETGKPFTPLTPRELRDALRNGQKVLERAKIEDKIENDKIRREMFENEQMIGDWEDFVWQSREETRRVNNKIANELQRVKDAEWKYWASQTVNVSNAMRTLMASFDFSGALRQGGYFAFSKPELQREMFGNMFRSLKEQTYGQIMQNIERQPSFIEAQRMGLDFAYAGKSEGDFTHGEELFRGEETIEALENFLFRGYFNPVTKAITKPSERTYTAFLDTQRIAMYAYFANELKAAGLTPARDKAEFKKIAQLINVATGRGMIPKSRAGRLIMDLPFFAPRYTLSRLQLLNMTLNPVAYANMPPHARKIVAKSALRFYGTTMSILGIAAMFGLVSFDDDDSDFLKITVGNTRYDIFAGALQPAKAIIKIGHSAWRTQIGTANRTKGEFGEDTMNIVGRYLRGKLSPGASYLTDFLMGSDYVGKTFDPVEGLWKRLIPLTISEMTESYKIDGPMGMLKAVPLSMMGIGVSTYKGAPEKPETDAEKVAAKIAHSHIPDKRGGRTDEEKAKAELVADLRARNRLGEDIEEELNRGIADGKITDRQAKEILAARYQSYLEMKAKKLNLEEMEILLQYTTDDEKLKIEHLVNDKMKEAYVSGTLKPDQRIRLEKQGFAIPGHVEMPDAVKSVFDQFGIKPPDVGKELTPKKGADKQRLLPAQYERYRKATLERIYKQVERIVESEGYKKASPEVQEKMIQKVISKSRSAEQKITKGELLKEANQ